MNICAFTGHRPTHFQFGYDEEHPLCKQLKKALHEQCLKLYHEENVRIYYSGCALGVDMWAAEAVLSLRDNGLSDIRLICAIPYPSHEAKWPIEQQQRLYGILSRADETITVSNRYSPDAYKLRNFYMVDRAQYLMAVFDRERRPRSGTLQTVNYGEKKKRKIIYINPVNAHVSSNF